ncbi:MAG: hypothetical protein AB7V43_03625 [Acidimicrobiia bacterium]
MSLLGRPRRKLSWDDLAHRLRDVGPGDLQLFHDDTCTWISWHEGPSIATVQAAVGDTIGWEWRSVAPSTEPSLPPSVTEVAAPSGAAVLWVRRSLSVPALATALVRFYGAHSRYFTTGDERWRERFAVICDVDDPAVSGFPIVDEIAARLLDHHHANTGAAGSDDEPLHPIDALSNSLRALGYENLWAEAYKVVP